MVHGTSLEKKIEVSFPFSWFCSNKSSNMAMMDNKVFLVSHIRNSFITSDDTGMCEMIIEVEDQEKKG